MRFVNSLSLLLLVLLCHLIKETIQYPLTYNNDNNYHKGQSEKSCQLMDGFSILIQLCLAFTALLTLIYKRSKESPQRPIQIWALDVSKQFIGAGMVHFINIAISNYAANNTTSNRCVWYFLNVAIDTTFGVFILWCCFTILLGALDKFDIDIGETGDYGPPPLQQMIWPWLRQISVFLLAQVLTKACLYEIVINSPWLFWLGEICMESILFIKDSQRSQVVFVMLIFPLIMNAIQFWFTDTILKVHQQEESKKQEEKIAYFSAPMIAALVEQTERTPLLFPPSKHRMAS